MGGTPNDGDGGTIWIIGDWGREYARFFLRLSSAASLPDSGSPRAESALMSVAPFGSGSVWACGSGSSALFLSKQKSINKKD
jgi:hypothetical protein